jgi:hypothetical protein
MLFYLVRTFIFNKPPLKIKEKYGGANPTGLILEWITRRTT